MRARTSAGTAALALLAFAGAGQAAAPPESNPCPEPSAPLALGSAQWNGWGRDVENTRYQPEPALRATDVPRLGLKWAFGFQGSAAAGQPTVVDGRLFTVSSAGRVYSLDARTGCTYWTFDAPSGVRTAISIGEFAPPRPAVAPRAADAPRRKRGKGHGGRKSRHSIQRMTDAHLEIFKAPSAAFFGDDAGAVYALDAQKGTLLWKTQIDAHPTARIVGAPTLHHDRLYVAIGSNEASLATDPAYACCSFRGAVAALDMATGHVLWQTSLLPDEARALHRNAAGAEVLGPAGAAVIAAPTVDAKRGLLYVGTGAALTGIDQPLADAVVALDLSSGQVRWSRQFARHDKPGAAQFDSSPILRTLADGHQILLAGQKSGIVFGLDPERGGEVLWQTQSGEGAMPAGIEWGPAADHRRLYVALSGLAAEPENSSGGLAALDIKTGIRRWFTPAPQSACSWGPENCNHAEAQAVTVIPGAAFSGAVDGHFRAYSTIDGKILWDTDTAKEFATVNGIKAGGGSLDQGGATIVNGVVYINSGYSQRSGLGHPGQPQTAQAGMAQAQMAQAANVLLAFSVDGK